MPNLHLLLKKLGEASVEFVIVGGYAGVLYGSSLVTNDVDICTIVSPGTVEKLRVALRDLHPIHRMTHQRLSFLEHPSAGETVQNLYLETDAGILDVLSQIDGVGDYQRLNAKAIEVELSGYKCRVISLSDLIRAKEAVGREKDLLAAKELRAIAAKRESTP
jgi:predicted nucleotidyltransferase